MDLGPVRSRHALYSASGLNHVGIMRAIASAADVPSLVDEVEALTAERNRLVETVERVRQFCDMADAAAGTTIAPFLRAAADGGGFLYVWQIRSALDVSSGEQKDCGT